MGKKHHNVEIEDKQIIDDNDGNFCEDCNAHLKLTAFQLAMDVPSSQGDGSRGGIKELLAIANDIYNFLIKNEIGKK